MIKFIKRLINKPIPKVELPKIVIAFSTSGCMGHIHKFEWLGVVKKIENNIYKIRVLVNEREDVRSGELKEEVAYQIQHIGLNIYIHYI